MGENTLNENSKKDKEGRMQEGKEPGNKDFLMDALKTLPDKDKKEVHLRKMLEVYRKASEYKCTFIAELDDSELDMAAASTGSAGHLEMCPWCGMELPAGSLEEHKRMVHKTP